MFALRIAIVEIVPAGMAIMSAYTTVNVSIGADDIVICDGEPGYYRSGRIHIVTGGISEYAHTIQYYPPRTNDHGCR